METAVLFAVVAMLRDFTAEEDLFFLLAERHRTERRHSELADHFARQFRRLFDVVAGARRHRFQEQFFCQTAAHHDRELAFQIRPGIRVTIVNRQLLRHAQAPCRAE